MKIDVTIGVVKKDEQILIVKRKEGEGNLRWQFPGGTLEDNETDKQAVVREVFEETGCTVIANELLGQRNHPYTKKNMSYWACLYVEGEIYISDDDLEEAIWVNKDELLEYFSTPVYEPILNYLGLAQK